MNSLVDLLLMIAAGAFGQAVGFALAVARVIAWVAEVIWTLIMQFFSLLIEWTDERWPDVGIADNPLLRALICGAVGLVIGIGILWFGALFGGRGDLSCLFILALAFTLFVGIMADPDRDWSFPPFPWWGGGGPKTPLNV